MGLARSDRRAIARLDGATPRSSEKDQRTTPTLEPQAEDPLAKTGTATIGDRPMLNSRRPLFLAAVTVVATALLGCKSDASEGLSQPGQPSVVECSECRTIWIDGSETYYTWAESSYESEARHACPDCKSAVENFFRTGRFTHSCTRCGENIRVCHPVGS